MAFFKKSEIKQSNIIPIEDDEEIIKFAKKSDKEKNKNNKENKNK